MIDQHYALLGRKARIDPLDALFRAAAQGEAPAEQIRLALCRSQFDVALDADGRPLIGPSPGGEPCLAVATCTARRERITAAGWRRVDLAELVFLLPDRVDVLFNPTGPVPYRLPGNAVREALLSGDGLAG